MLGIGGVRALRALGITPHAYHLNEGHSAFLTLELVREQVARAGLRERVPAAPRQCVFTTHTPVPAGNDTFDPALMQEVLGDFLEASASTRETVLRARPASSERQHGAVLHDAAGDPAVALAPTA